MENNQTTKNAGLNLNVLEGLMARGRMPVKFTYLRSGKEVKSISPSDEKGYALLQTGTQLLKDVKLEQTGVLKWEGKLESADEKILVKQMVKVWKVTSYCWVLYLDVTFANRINGVTIKARTNYASSLLTLLGVSKLLLGEENVTEMLPHWSAAHDLLALSPTYFEKIFNTKEEIALYAFTEYGVLSPEMSKEELIEIAEKAGVELPAQRLEEESEEKKLH